MNVKLTGFFAAAVANKTEEAAVVNAFYNAKDKVEASIKSLSRAVEDLKDVQEKATRDLNRSKEDLDGTVAKAEEKLNAPTSVDYSTYMEQVSKVALLKGSQADRAKAIEEELKSIEIRVKGAEAKLKAAQDYYDANFTEIA